MNDTLSIEMCIIDTAGLSKLLHLWLHEDNFQLVALDGGDEQHAPPAGHLPIFGGNADAERLVKKNDWTSS